MTDHLPAFRLNLEQQRKRAKDLLRAVQAADNVALKRFLTYHPAGTAAPMRLSEAQLVIARELGLPSWPKLNGHIRAMEQARAASTALDSDAATLHIRCGSDVKSRLREAGFTGDFLEYSDPFCQGPVVDAPDWLHRRAVFLATSYGSWLDRDLAAMTRGLEQAEIDLRTAAQHYARVVMWFEHDSYDQLILARCLSQFAETPPRRLELISVAQFPGGARFIGLGQLPPEALRLLWPTRQTVNAAQLAAGRSAWAMLRASDPTQLAAFAQTGIPALPQLAGAILRHCQELPGRRDGLGLTERLVLQLLSEAPRTVGEVFRDLMQEREPLPWLGDIMLRSILDIMRRASRPVFTTTPGSDPTRWAREELAITDLGDAVLAGRVDWLSLRPPERWVGGVRIAHDAPCWRWDDATAMPVLTAAVPA